MNLPTRTSRSAGGPIALVVAALALSACERPPVETVQIGYRGVQMQKLVNPRTEAERRAANVVPVALPAAAVAEGDVPLARDIYQNVSVVGDLQITEFNRLMLAITEWVAPKEEGCNFCHSPDNLAEDVKYTKIVSRRMLEMTRHINMQWTDHVKQTGVTCYTCHRGKNVPAAKWFQAAPDGKSGVAASRDGQNLAAPAANLSSLPGDPFTIFFASNPQPIRVLPTAALPGSAGAVRAIKQTEHSYALMMHMSEGLGVNCTFCHNSRSFAEWAQSTPQRAQSWHGIQLVRDINVNYLAGLTPQFPANRLGPTGDVAKVNCATCHRGVSKPLYGAPMASDYPELTRVRPAPPPAPPAAEEPATPVASRGPATDTQGTRVAGS
jgi:photosynthetic reaction center cytochrome c subunit